jgi:hypothetical protein
LRKSTFIAAGVIAASLAVGACGSTGDKPVNLISDAPDTIVTTTAKPTTTTTTDRPSHDHHDRATGYHDTASDRSAHDDGLHPAGAGDRFGVIRELHRGSRRRSHPALSRTARLCIQARP